MDEQQQILRAAVDRIIPADDFPGAWDAGVGNFIDRLLAGDLRHEADKIRQGLIALNAEAAALFNSPLPQLSATQQDDILHRVEEGRTSTQWPIDPRDFFRKLVELTMEGYYSDPGNGGNRDQIAWKMMGYEPRQQLKVRTL